MPAATMPQKALEAAVAAFREQVTKLEQELNTQANHTRVALKVAHARGALLVRREAQLAQLDAEIRALRGSTSWRFTALLRALKRLMSKSG